MNPARLVQLYDARFPGVRTGHQHSRDGRDPSVPIGTRYVDLSPREDDEDDGTRLAAYFAGGA